MVMRRGGGLRRALGVVFAATWLACHGGAGPKEALNPEPNPNGSAPPEPVPTDPKSLYERLGGQSGLGSLVDAFVKNVTANDVLKKRFAKLPKDRLDKFRASLADQLCQVTGGNCSYAGKTMKEAHKGLKISENEWNASVTALKAALDETNVGEEEQSDLIAIVAPMRDEIVEVKSKPQKGRM